MKDDIIKIEQEAVKDIAQCNSLEQLKEVKSHHVSKKSPIMSLMGKLGSFSIEEKKEIGALVNNAKNKILFLIEEKQTELEKEEVNRQLAEEQIDISMPGYNFETGGKNPWYIIKDQMTEIFLGMGYLVAEGPEVEDDHHNFELLNTPKGHPARDMQDTFYISETKLLRTHTSPVQAREMQKAQGKPIKIICPGKVFRRDDDDLTHSHQFGQIEGLLIDENVSLANLKATLELFVKKMFGEKRSIRLRSSYFPFTEPSVEVDISCAKCMGKGCGMCHETGYIEILGAGMVHPRVLEMNGYDSSKYQGFAFGIGIERVAMLRYGIDDIRRLYQNDLRFLSQFKKGV